MQSLKRNAILNTIQTLMKIIFPLITFPYAAHVLGVEELGKYNYSNSIVNYYILLASLGITTYAIREGTPLRDNKEKLEEFAKNIFSLNVYTTVIATIILGIGVIFINKLTPYRTLIIILSLQVIFDTVGRNWIYSIYENYFFVAVRSVIFQIISIILLFLFVKDEQDVLIYAGITTLGTVGNNLVNVIDSKRLCKHKFTFKPDTCCLTSILLIFSTQVSITIYGSSDITILGILGNDYYVGLYSVSVKIYNIIKQLVAATLTVTIPRFSYLLGKNMKLEYDNLFISIFNMLIVILLPVSVGLCMLSSDCIYIIAGEAYMKASFSLKVLSIAMIFNLITYMLGYCVLIPYKKEKTFFAATTYSAIVNIILNIVTIPYYLQDAAAITTLVAEMMAAFICYKESKRYICFKNMSYNLWCGLCGCIGIIFCCYILSFISNMILHCIISIVLSSIVYITIQLLINKNIIKEMIGRKLKKGKKNG